MWCHDHRIVMPLIFVFSIHPCHEWAKWGFQLFWLWGIDFLKPYSCCNAAKCHISLRKLCRNLQSRSSTSLMTWRRWCCVHFCLCRPLTALPCASSRRDLTTTSPMSTPPQGGEHFPAEIIFNHFNPWGRHLNQLFHSIWFPRWHQSHIDMNTSDDVNISTATERDIILGFLIPPAAEIAITESGNQWFTGPRV